MIGGNSRIISPTIDVATSWSARPAKKRVRKHAQMNSEQRKKEMMPAANGKPNPAPNCAVREANSSTQVRRKEK